MLVVVCWIWIYKIYLEKFNIVYFIVFVVLLDLVDYSF